MTMESTRSIGPTPARRVGGREMPRGLRPELSIVVPCFDEEEVLPLLFERIRGALEACGIDYEVILVNDGSTDGSALLMEELHRRDARWKSVHLSRNFGHQLALWTGLGAARGAAVAVLDADLQDPPELLPAMLERRAAGFDVVYGVRKRRKENLLKRAAYHGFYRLLSLLSEIDVPLDSGDFCLMDRRVVEVIRSVADRRPFIRGLRAWVGFRQTALEYDRQERAGGEAKYTFTKLWRLALDGILSSSLRPLRVATVLGTTVSLVSFLGAVFTLLQRLFAEQFARWGLAPVPGFATIVISILFLGGVQLLTIGILGEYVGRIYQNVDGRPACVVARTVGIENGSGPPRGDGGPSAVDD
jgi:glycosyltransferase involved in cell wall biosynthesis